MSTDNVQSAISSLREDLDFSNQYGRDTSEGTTVAKTIENVEIKRNEQGKWEKITTDKDFPAKKDITARTDELEFYENSIDNLTIICANADKKLYDAVTEINQNKQLIINSISSAISGGCSCILSAAIVNGVSIGIGSTVHLDYASINEYSNMTGNSQNPFGSDNKKELTPSRLGSGYKTNFEINKGVGIGSYYTVNGFTAFGLPSSTCQGYRDAIDAAAAEIGSLRGTISGQTINDTNTVKDKKTEYELFAWSYRNTDKLVAEQKQQTENVIGVINNQSDFQ